MPLLRGNYMVLYLEEVKKNIIGGTLLLTTSIWLLWEFQCFLTKDLIPGGTSLLTFVISMDHMAFNLHIHYVLLSINPPGS